MLSYPYHNFYEVMQANTKNDPKKTAIFIDDRKVSYQELKAKIDGFARVLVSLGLQAKERVAMIVGNSEEFVIALYAITKLGAVAVPLNTFLKKEEFDYILNDAQARLLISSASFANETKELLHTTPGALYARRCRDSYSLPPHIKSGRKFLYDIDVVEDWLRNPENYKPVAKKPGRPQKREDWRRVRV